MSWNGDGPLPSADLAIDAAGLALQLLNARDVADGNDVIDEERQVRGDHDRVRAGQTRRYQSRGWRDDEIHFAGEESLNYNRAGADRDYFGIQAVLLEEAFLVGDPDWSVRRRAARPRDAHALLSRGGIRKRQARHDENHQLQQPAHYDLLTFGGE